MSKVLLGKLGDNVNRSALGHFVSKKNTKVAEYEDKVCVIDQDKDMERLIKKFGEPLTVREASEDDAKLEAKKLSEVK